jgi:hypothetical protein
VRLKIDRWKRAGHAIWALAWGAAMVLAAGTAAAQPVFELAHVDTQKNTEAYVFVDCYLAESEYWLDYNSLTILSPPQHGSVTVYDGWGVAVYTPDEDYEGFDGFTYSMKDELGNESAPSFVLMYVEPEGSITNLQPVIVGFCVVNLGTGDFVFNGYVLDDQDTYGRVVEFGGELAGQTMTIGYDGMFSYLGTIPPQSGGIVTVRYQDPYTVYSEETAQWVENF